VELTIKVKCVHAWVRGEVTEMPKPSSDAPVLVTYNPYATFRSGLRERG
jgi:hypothetical protein